MSVPFLIGAYRSASADVRLKRGSTEQPGLALLHGLDHPLEAHRVRFGGVAAHHYDQIGIFNVGP